MERRTEILGESLAYFGGGALALFVAVQVGIPFLQQQGISPVISWFLASGVIVGALFVFALWASRRESGAQTVWEIFRALKFQPITHGDVAWALGGLIAVVVFSAIVNHVALSVFSINLLSQESYASFLRLERLKPDQYWIFLVWLPYFFFNIFGEECLWRGYLLPRQREVLGSRAWILNGALWSVFHIGIGVRIAFLLLPIEFIVPYVVQRRQNTWLGVIVHGVFNGTGFILVALGAVA